ncbi:MAG: hypothetical protein WC843_02980 [Candidatus Gracilibacteria bacterium]|jgi:hypothetical protein
MLKKINKFLVKLAIFSATLAVVLTASMPLALAENAKTTTTLPLPSISTPGYSGLQAPAQGSASAQVFSLALSVIQNVRYLLGAVAVGLIVYAGIRMVIGGGNEEVYTKQRSTIIYGIIGLAVVGFSGDLARIFSVYCENGKDFSGLACTQGGFLKDPNAIIRSVTIFDQKAKFIVTFIKYLIGAISVFFVVRSGMRMIAMGSAEDKIALDKKNLAYGALGLFLIIIADPIINNVFYKVDVTRYPTVGGAAPSFNPAQGVSELVGFTNMVLSIVSPIAIIALVAGGIMYIASAGNEETQGKAKRIIVSALVGIIIMYGSFAIVSTIISGNFGTSGNGQVTQPTGGTLPGQ